MGYTKDLWTRPAKGPDGKVKRGPKDKVIREPNSRWGKGKRWLACWLDPDGAERTKAFANQRAADAHWKGMEVDVERGDYIDPKAGKGTLGELAQAWLASWTGDPKTRETYESVYRTHVEPEYGRKAVARIKPSSIQTFLSGLNRSTARHAKVVLTGMLDLAVADGAIKANPTRSDVVKIAPAQTERVIAWLDHHVFGAIDAHPDGLKLLPLIAATCGLRAGELFGLAVEDIDYEAGKVHVRRQIKRVGKAHVFALPKRRKQRSVPLPESVADEIREHVRAHRPHPCVLPWAEPDGPPRSAKILFRWRDGKHVRQSAYHASMWLPALTKAGVIPAPTREKVEREGQRPLRRVTYVEGDWGIHQLRHWFASVQLADGVTVKELAEYLGHTDPGFTLRVYAHMLPDSHDRSRTATDRRVRASRLDAHPDLAEVAEMAAEFYSDGT